MKINNFAQHINEVHLLEANLHQNGYWSKEQLQKEANKYETRSEFYKSNKYAYFKALRMNILDELFKNHLNNGYSKKQKISGYWTQERLQEEADRYKTRREFNKNSKSAYGKAQKMNILDKLFKNHIDHGYINKEVYVYELKEFNSAYIGLTKNQRFII